MSDQPQKGPSLAPFVIVDVLFLAMAAALLAFSHRPMLWWEACLMILCGAVAAWSLTAPFLRRDSNAQAHSQSVRFAEVAAELQKVQSLAAHLQAATDQWKSLQAQSSLSLDTAKQLSQSFSAEAKAFAEMLQKSSDSEKTHLRLEVEKLRRAEGEWLQTLIRVLDHVFALSQAAQRSGQRGLIDQISLFQDSCREAARRVGLAPIAPRAGEPFDPRAHQLLDNAEPPEKARVGEIVATAFTYQGQLLRRAFVTVQTPPPAEPSKQDDLALTQETEP